MERKSVRRGRAPRILRSRRQHRTDDRHHGGNGRTALRRRELHEEISHRRRRRCLQIRARKVEFIPVRHAPGRGRRPGRLPSAAGGGDLLLRRIGGDDDASAGARKGSRQRRLLVPERWVSSVRLRPRSSTRARPRTTDGGSARNTIPNVVELRAWFALYLGVWSTGSSRRLFGAAGKACLLDTFNPWTDFGIQFTKPIVSMSLCVCLCEFVCVCVLVCVCMCVCVSVCVYV